MWYILKPNILASMGYHIFLTMLLRARAPKTELRARSSAIRELDSGTRRTTSSRFSHRTTVSARASQRHFGGKNMMPSSF